MAFTLRDNTSPEKLVDFTHSVTAGLTANLPEYPGLGAELPAWNTLGGEAKALLSELDSLLQLEITARAVLRSWDRRWDKSVGRVSSESYHLANKKSDAEPYVSLFGAVKAKEARQMGYDRAVEFSTRLIDRAKILNHPGLALVLADFEKVTAELQTAGAARDAATRKVELQRLKIRQWIPTVQQQMHATEAVILSLAPGDDDLVRTILSADEA